MRDLKEPAETTPFRTPQEIRPGPLVRVKKGEYVRAEDVLHCWPYEDGTGVWFIMRGYNSTLSIDGVTVEEFVRILRHAEESQR